MRYNLYIGEFEPVICEEERYARAGVRDEDGEALGAPLNSSNLRGNACSPDHLVWHNFAAEVGLLSEFFGGKRTGPRGTMTPYFMSPSVGATEGLLIHHPGAQPLTRDHLESFIRARLRYKKRPANEQDEYVLRRLDWLCWWAAWALETCKYPTFANS